MKKFGKFVLGSLSLATLAAGGYYIYKKFIANESDDFDDFDDDFDDFDDFDDLDADEENDETEEKAETEELIETTEEINNAITLVIIPPKYGITVVIHAKTPSNKKLGCPIIRNKSVYSKN